MNPPTIVELADVSGKPRVKMDLPSPLRLGDKVRLAFKLQRKNDRRTEVLTVSGDFRVASVGFDSSGGPTRQLISVEAVGKAPAWQSVKNIPTVSRKFPPTHFPRTEIS